MIDHERQALVQRMRQQRDEIRQWFYDIEHWNRLHPTDAFMLDEIDPSGMMAKFAAALDLSLAREDGLASRP
jgi:hypothetical protein